MTEGADKPIKPARPVETPIATLRAELRTLSAKQRVARILDRSDALKVVRALPPLDLYATLREVGIEEVPEILELASPAQVQAFLDLDGWRGDRLDSHAVSGWMRALFAANPDRATGQLRALDLELFTLLFKLHCSVIDLSQEEEPGDDVGLHTITPDRRYLIAYGGVADDEQMQIVLKELIERLMGRDIGFVLHLCEAIRWDLPSALEESALRWRNGRLADLGFLPRHEALEVFAWLDPDGKLPDVPVHARAAVTLDEDSLTTDLSTSVVLPWELLADGTRAFGAALQTLPEVARARIAHELALVANRVHTADGGDSGDPAALTQTARHTVDTIGTALAYRAKGDPQRMPHVLGTVPLLALFRVGNSLTLKIARDLQRLIGAKDGGLSGDGLLRLDTPLRETAAGLLRNRPLLFGGLLDARRADYRPPASLAELAAAAAAVKEIALRGALFSARGFGAPPTAADRADAPSHSAWLGTLLARALVGAPLLVEPLPRDALTSLRAALKDDAARGRARDAVVERAQRAAPLPGAADENELIARVRAYAASAMTALREELDRVRDDEIEAHYVGALVIG